MRSVEERLAYKGGGDERHIDKTLLFTHFMDGYAVEQRLHVHFSKEKAFGGRHPGMPLYQNGQSELYARDVLRLDEEYSEEQGQETMRRVHEAVPPYVPPKEGWPYQIARVIFMILLFPIVFGLLALNSFFNKKEEEAYLRNMREGSAERAKDLESLLRLVAESKKQADQM